MEILKKINRANLQKALIMYRNYLNIYSHTWKKEEREQANKTLLTLWIFFSETVKLDKKEGVGLEEDAESINEFCQIIIDELTSFNEKIKTNTPSIN